MGVHTKASPEMIGALAHSKRPFSLPTWAQVIAAAPRRYNRDVEIFGQQEPAEYLYKVVSGAVRTFSVLRDGRRHIAEFYLAGEFFGLEADSKHTLSAAAICNSKLLVIKHSVLAVLAEHDKDIARRLRDMMRDELWRAQAHATMLIKTSSERVADFLLEMADRSPETNEIELPMSQREIGDHLGLTIETVSRTFAKFEAATVIERQSLRHVTLRNRAALEQLQHPDHASRSARASCHLTMLPHGDRWRWSISTCTATFQRSRACRSAGWQRRTGPRSRRRRLRRGVLLAARLNRRNKNGL